MPCGTGMIQHEMAAGMIQIPVCTNALALQLECMCAAVIVTGSHLWLTSLYACAKEKKATTGAEFL